MRKIMTFKESIEFSKLEDKIKEYLKSIGFNGSLITDNFIQEIIKGEIKDNELLSEDELRHILSIVRDSKIGSILR
jgi:hypothetical protein